MIPKNEMTGGDINVFILATNAEVARIVAEIENNLAQLKSAAPDRTIRKIEQALPAIKKKLLSRGLLPATKDLNHLLVQVDERRRGDIVARFNSNAKSAFQIIPPQPTSVDSKFICNLYIPAPLGANPDAVRMLFNRAKESSSSLFVIDLIRLERNASAPTPVDAARQIFN
jgi:hypothetical protein